MNTNHNHGKSLLFKRMRIYEKDYTTYFDICINFNSGLRKLGTVLNDPFSSEIFCPMK